MVQAKSSVEIIMCYDKFFTGNNYLFDKYSTGTKYLVIKANIS